MSDLREWKRAQKWTKPRGNMLRVCYIILHIFCSYTRHLDRWADDFNFPPLQRHSGGLIYCRGAKPGTRPQGLQMLQMLQWTCLGTEALTFGLVRTGPDGLIIDVTQTKGAKSYRVCFKLEPGRSSVTSETHWEENQELFHLISLH